MYSNRPYQVQRERPLKLMDEEEEENQNERKRIFQTSNDLMMLYKKKQNALDEQ